MKYVDLLEDFHFKGPQGEPFSTPQSVFLVSKSLEFAGRNTSSQDNILWGSTMNIF